MYYIFDMWNVFENSWEHLSSSSYDYILHRFVYLHWPGAQFKYLKGFPLLHCHPLSKSKLFSPIHRDVPKLFINPASKHKWKWKKLEIVTLSSICNWQKTDFVPEMYDCSCSSTMLRRSAPCCWQLFLAWLQVSTDCAFLWYWTPVTGSVSQPEDAAL